MVLVGGGRLSFNVVGFSKLAAKVSGVAWGHHFDRGWCWRVCLTSKLDPAPGLDFGHVLGDAVCAERGLARRLSRVG